MSESIVMGRNEVHIASYQNSRIASAVQRRYSKDNFRALAVYGRRFREQERQYREDYPASRAQRKNNGIVQIPAGEGHLPQSVRDPLEKIAVSGLEFRLLAEMMRAGDVYYIGMGYFTGKLDAVGGFDSPTKMAEGAFELYEATHWSQIGAVVVPHFCTYPLSGQEVKELNEFASQMGVTNIGKVVLPLAASEISEFEQRFNAMMKRRIH